MGTEKEVEKVTKLTITAKEATERLAMAGIRIGYEKLRAALKQGKLPFGFTIDMEGGHTEFVKKALSRLAPERGQKEYIIFILHRKGDFCNGYQ